MSDMASLRARGRYPRLAVLAALGIVLAVLLLPRPLRTEHAARPSRPAVVAAIRYGTVERLSGRILHLGSRSFVLRLVMGSREVGRLSRAAISGSRGSPLARSALHTGDKVTVAGYPLGALLLAITIQDSSRQ